MVFSAFRSSRPGMVMGLLALAAGVGLLEGGFILLLRSALGGDASAAWGPLLAAAFGLVTLRSLLQGASARLETARVFSWIADLRADLLALVSSRRAPVYRSPWREPLALALDRGLDDLASGAAAGLRCHSAAVQAGLLVPLLLLFSWKPAAAALLLALPVFALSRYRSASLARAGSAWSASSESLARGVAAFAESLEGAAGDGLLPARAASLSASRASHEGRARAWELSKALFPPLLEWLFFAALALLLALALPGRASGSDWAASLLPFTALLLLLHRPVRDWARAWPARLPGDRAYAAYRTLRDTLVALPERKPPEAALGDAIRIDGLCFAYPGAATPVFSGFSAEVDPTALTWIPGPNGSGKTTFLRLLAGIEWPEAGSVALPDPLRAHPRPFAYLPQRAVIDPDYAEWAAGYAAASPAAWKRLDAILGLSPLLARGGGFRPEALSGGQRQRLALGRTFASDSPCLLLDEPTTALAAGDRERILGDLLAFRRERPGTGAVMVSHEPFLGEFCGATIRLDRGLHAAAGTGTASAAASGGAA